MSKLDRLLLILNLLRSRRTLTASHLADECEVSERTIYRDVRTLSEAKVPIYFDGGYKVLTDAFLPPLSFTVDELLCLYMGLHCDPIQSVSCFRKSAKLAWAKLESLIPERIKSDYDKVKGHITVHPEKRRFRQSVALTFELLRQAIWSEKKIKLGYVSAQSSEVIELVPQALIYKRGNWYLVGLVQERTKHFRLDMIRNVSLS